MILDIINYVKQWLHAIFTFAARIRSPRMECPKKSDSIDDLSPTALQELVISFRG